LIYTEQLLLAQQLEDEALAHNALAAWSEREPDNVSVRKLLAELDVRPVESKTPDRRTD
jgi:hypothetical protein